jgi:23S rRNA pseudouridine2605 synthase
MRIAKYLAHAGVASRRHAEDLIDQGRVRVDGKTIRTPVFFVEEGMQIEVDGERVASPSTQTQLVYAFHKPIGVVATAYDPQGRTTVVEFAPPSAGRVYPVGRLDIESTGLLLLTNDGELAHRLTHPKFEVPKTYDVRVSKAPIKERELSALRKGVLLEDGWTAPAEVEQVGHLHLQITIHEGRNRQVRRMLEEVGHPVRSLCRVSYGPLELGLLHPGDIRRLKQPEIDALYAASDADQTAPGPRRPGEPSWENAPRPGKQTSGRAGRNGRRPNGRSGTPR